MMPTPASDMCTSQHQVSLSQTGTSDRPGYTHYHSQYLAHSLTLAGRNEDAMAKTLTAARVDMNPHQVDAALFALASPVAKGVLLADEVGLGKTIEAALVMAQRWAERRRRILLIVPASLRKQWQQELWDKFALPSQIMEAHSYRERSKTGERRPFAVEDAIVLCSYEFAARKSDEIAAVSWDLVVLDEAHRLRNVHSAKASSRSRVLQDALRRPFKLLLTATPLQNNIMELYGLASFMDERAFGNAQSFRAQYGGVGTNPAKLLQLRERLKHVCRRTLRRTVMEAGHISYTQRLPVTFRFDPHLQEARLYDEVSAFLQRPDTCYLGGKANALVTMTLRKILGSSSFAITQTLTRIIERLQTQQVVANLETLSDLDTIGEMAEELDDAEEGDDAETDPENPTPEMIEAEIKELTSYRDLAASITTNAKGERLVRELPALLDTVMSKGGARKVVIFTESVRTQSYLASLLARNGFADEIILLNGSNADPDSQSVYRDWLARHAGTDRVSGSKSADTKAAVVDAFRIRRTILIATESGAEGINLQFCSLLVNYDLPWNPQRVEQRIGRCHRYGQKIDVTVVNLLNAQNHAEQRVFHLLQSKFRLFEGVFGASDEILGVIENGVDFERRVHEIVQNSRSAEQVEVAFDQLTASLQPQIAADMQAARDKLLRGMDEDVVAFLKVRGDNLTRTLSGFERRLTLLARAELPEATFREHDGGSPVFDYNGQTWTTNWPLADQHGWQFFRVTEGSLGGELIARAVDRALPIAEIRFDYGAYQSTGEGRFVDVEHLVGHAGWMRISKMSLRAGWQAVEHIIAAAQTDAGQPVGAKTVERMFLLPGSTTPVASTPPSGLNGLEAVLQADARRLAEQENSRWFQAETDKLEAYGADLSITEKHEVQKLEHDVTVRRRALNSASGVTVQQKIEERRAIKLLEDAIDIRNLALVKNRRAFREEIDTLLDQLHEDITLNPTVEAVFTIRWAVTA